MFSAPSERGGTSALQPGLTPSRSVSGGEPIRLKTSGARDSESGIALFFQGAAILRGHQRSGEALRQHAHEDATEAVREARDVQVLARTEGFDAFARRLVDGHEPAPQRNEVVTRRHFTDDPTRGVD